MEKLKVLFLFYSGAGNTLLLSSTLKERFEKDGHQVKLTNLKKDSEIPDLSNCNIVVLATPVYAYHVPQTVMEFLQRLPNGNASFFLLFTKGLILGNSAYEAQNILRKKGYKIKGFSDIIMADTLFLLTAKQGGMLEKIYLLPNRIASFRLNSIYKSIIKSIHCEKEVKLRPKIYAPITNFIANWFHKKTAQFKKELFADEHCTLCGVCVKVCPRNNIKIDQSRVIFGDDCEFCTACIHRCPVESIQVGSKTQGKSRYRIGKEAKYLRKWLK